MRVFATKWFVRFARKEGLSEKRLREAIERVEQGSIDADLGGNLIKQRVARSGRGRSSGYRTLIAYQAAKRSVFLYGFAKQERDNIDARELADLKKLVARFLSLDDEQIGKAVEAQELKELTTDGEDDKEG